MEKHQVLTVLVADDEPELLGAVCQLIDWESLASALWDAPGTDWTRCSWWKRFSRISC